MAIGLKRSGRRRIELPRLGPRAEKATTKVEFGELTPDTLPFLGQAAYIQLEFFESLARAVATAPTLASKEGISVQARVALKKHHRLIAEIRDFGAVPAEVMAPFAASIDAFHAATDGADWPERMLSCHITSGILDDFFVELAGSLPPVEGGRVRRILERRAETDAVAAELAALIEADTVLASRLAMWGRRLVGDTLLVARSALRESNAHAPVAAEIEPVFTDLIAAHTRRMDALGLTA